MRIDTFERKNFDLPAKIGHNTDLKLCLTHILNSIVMNGLIFGVSRLISQNECQMAMHKYHLAENIN